MYYKTYKKSTVTTILSEITGMEGVVQSFILNL